MFQIGQFSRMSGLSVDTLRHYDALGILRPASVDPASGYRLYEASQLREVYRILVLKDAGFALPEIAAMQADALPVQALIALLEAKADTMLASINSQQNRLDRLLSNIFLLKNGGIPHMQEITIKATEPILVCSQRRSIPRETFDKALEAMWPAVNTHIQAQGGRRVIPCLMLYHDGTWTHVGDRLDIEVAEPIASAIQSSADILVYSLPAEARMACIVHHGSFQTISKAYTALFDWIKQNGYTAKGPLREIYHKGDWATNNPEEYITELQIPVV